MENINPKYVQQPEYDDSVISDKDVLRLEVERINESEASLDDVISAEGGTLYIGIDSEWQRIENRNANHVLCYTAAVYTKDVNEECKERCYIIHTAGQRRSQRLSLNKFLANVVQQAKLDKMIAVWPANIVVFCHFMRADVVNFADFWYDKDKLGLEALRNTVVSLGLPKSLVKEFKISNKTEFIYINENKWMRRKPLILRDRSKIARRTNVRFIDTLLLSPLTNSGLKAIGDLIGLPKLEIPEGYSISNMLEFREEQPEMFEAYALRDAQIALRFGIHMMHTIGQEFGQNKLPTTLGSLGVKLVEESFDSKQHFQGVFGLTEKKIDYYHPKEHRIIPRKEKRVDPVVDLFFKHAANSFKGGHNVAYAIGATEGEVATDLDLTGAYSMGLLDLFEPDYSKQYSTNDKNKFKGHVLGFAYAEVKFPENVRYPTAAFRAGAKGLYFTRKGTDYLTAPEIDLALRLGADVKILAGCIIPWKNERRFFEPVIKDLRKKRKSHPKKSLKNEMYKLLMNSIFGKTGQGISNANSFNTITQESKTIPPSKITNPFIAAHITGFIRAVLGELINNLPQDVTLINSITDGFLSTIKIEDPNDIQPHEVDITGPLCQRFQELVTMIDPDAHMLEVKSKSNQLICGKVRLHFTTIPHPDWFELKDRVLAKGSLSIPQDKMDDPHAYIAGKYLTRTHESRVTNTHLISTREQWLTESDLVDYQREIRLSMDFDFKREPYNPRMVKTPYGECLTYDTRPWDTVEEGKLAREMFDAWRENHCMTTVELFEDFEDYYQLQLAKNHTKMRRQKEEDCGDIFIRLFITAYAKELYEIKKEGTYIEIAQWLTDEGYPRKKSHFVNARNAQVYTHCVPYTQKAMKAVRLILSKFPALSLAPFFEPEALNKVLADLGNKC